MVMEDEDRQTRGRVVISWTSASVLRGDFDPASTFSVTTKSNQGLPIKLNAIHFCIESSGEEFPDKLIASWSSAVNARSKVRTRIHLGTPAQLKEKLQGYGIPAVTIPVSDDGEWDLSGPKRSWARWRLEEEEVRKTAKRENELQTDSDTPTAVTLELSDSVTQASDTSSLTVTPVLPLSQQHSNFMIATPVNAVTQQLPPLEEVTDLHDNDVLFGRGKNFNNYKGNIAFRLLIEENRRKYESMSKPEKTKLGAEIVKIVQSRSGRFLRESSRGAGLWIEVDDGDARRKVANCFRTIRHHKKKVGTPSR
eukprot:CAMPEP_0176019962 /NCGR_PEP_ID=MMETSP0120_2-20121206/9658_1 /TAXON_ID=160619 /ORGANISM="Kryptoperidinium foliaceum, Strain CCMP 1326" /LENGTH=308 /DNA_ID=CAMNT_0017353049 /DNA_START=70 /DNA_END=996 /DNA_ORIENTATION=-